MDNISKGYYYELQVKFHIINKLNKLAYLWSEAPENILINNNNIGSHNEHRLNRKNKLIDTGIDIIQLEDNNICSLVQCKNGYKGGITMEHLAGFMCWLFSLHNLNGYVYYTNKLSTNLKELPKNDRIKYIKLPYEKTQNKEIKIIKSFDYQIEAFNKFNEYFKNNNQGILSLPCGTGKTFTSYIISEKYNQIIIISPLKQFAKQNLDRFIEYGYKNKTLLVDSDGERDMKEIKKFIKSNDKCLISCTYDSVDVIYPNLKYMNNVLIIVDEFHNLSKNNIFNEDDYFYKILNSDNKILFMSATPRIYELENEDYNDIEIVYNMTFTDAIKNNYITDYKIWLPSIHEDNTQLNQELSIYEIDENIKSKCNFLLSCLLNNGSMKCIIYCIDTNELNLMIYTINELNNFYYIDYDINQITSKTTFNNRTKILNDFEINNKLQLLFSIRILDECIDIPSCDSIYITYPSQSKIRTIQRLSRCIRIDKNNKFKIGNIFIWCNEYDKILETLSGIKEYDVFFKDKIYLNETNFYNKSNKIDFNKDKKLIEKYILGIKEFKQYTWNDKFKQVKKYIDENKCRPSNASKDNNIKQLGKWISTQQTYYNKNEYIMKDTNIKLKWDQFIDKYKDYFLSNEEIWYNNLEKVKKYIDKYNFRPAEKSKDNNIKQLGKWICTQKTNYKKNENIMKNNNIRIKWEQFIDEYNEYFLSNEEIWYNNLEKVKKYIDEYKCRPVGNNKNIKILTNWICKQQINYKINKNIMKYNNIKVKWQQFIDEYKEYLLSNEEIWHNNLEKVKKYIDEYKCRPAEKSIYYNIKQLGQWICTQQHNYKNNKQNMKDNNIKVKWEQFIDKYKEYFLSNEELWNNNLQKVKLYINENNYIPAEKSKDNNIKQLGKWICTQKTNYKKNENIMKDNNIRIKWEQFIDQYKEYFIK